MRPSHRPLVAILSAIALLASLAGPVAAQEPRGPVQVGTDLLARDSWIVELIAGANGAEAPGLAQAAGGTVGARFTHVLNGFQFHGSAQAAAALQRNPRVASVWADRPLLLSDLLPLGAERISSWEPGGTEGAYQQGFRGNGARIAVLDTGIDVDHPDLVGNIDAALGLNCLNRDAAPNDGYGHGTHVAGTAAAPYNGIGVVGVAPEARLVAVKMFDDAGNSSEALALCALDHIVGLNTDADRANDVDVANMSWGESRTWGGCGTDTDPLHDAICAAHAAGIILVAGSGNSAVNGNTFVPAAYPEVISVSAWTDLNGEAGPGSGCQFIADIFWFECDETFALFSNWGDVDVMAPGVAIYSTWAGGGYKYSSGTSMASPHIAGIAALMAAAAPGLSPADALAALLASGECPNGQAADADGTAGCVGQGTWAEDPDGTPEPMGHALRAPQHVADGPPPPPDPVPPSAPVLSAEASESSIELSWTAPAEDGGAPITGYEVYRGSSSGSAALHATLGVVSSYSDASAAPGETWFYQVAAVNPAGVGARSNQVSATVPEPPPPPDPVPPSAPTLSAVAGDASVQLSWTAPADDGGASVTGYEIYRGTAPGSASLVATVGAVLGYQDAGLVNGTTYWYQVAAVNSAGVGARSNEASAQPSAPVAAPLAPGSLKAQKLSDGIRLTWVAPASTGGSPLTQYAIYRTGGSGGTATFAVQATSLVFVDTTVSPRTAYAYVVTAFNAVGESAASNVVTVRSR